MSMLGPHKGVCVFSAKDQQPTSEAVIIAHGSWEPSFGYTEVPLSTAVHFYQSHWDFGKSTVGIALAKGENVPDRYTTTDPGVIDTRTYKVTPGATHWHATVKTIAGPGARINDYHLSPHEQVNDELFLTIFKLLIAGGGKDRKDVIFIYRHAEASFSRVWKALNKFNRRYAKIHSTACRVVPNVEGEGWQSPGH